MNVLLSISPKYAEAITDGRKSYEFRRSIFNQRSVERVYLYVTKPVGKVVGSFKVGEIIRGEPMLLWEQFGPLSGVTQPEFFEYFKNTDTGFAIKIEDLEVYSPVVDPQIIINDFKPPRSFRYIDGQFSHIDGIRSSFSTQG